jgi:hypothetical protein
MCTWNGSTKLDLLERLVGWVVGALCQNMVGYLVAMGVKSRVALECLMFVTNMICKTIALG